MYSRPYTRLCYDADSGIPWHTGSGRWKEVKLGDAAGEKVENSG